MTNTAAPATIAEKVAALRAITRRSTAEARAAGYYIPKSYAELMEEREES